MIRYMRLQIPYNEFEQLLSKYFQQQLINQIKLAYADESTGMAFDLKWEQVLELCEDVVKDMLEVQDNHTVLVHFDKIGKLNTILEKVEMQSISFEPDYINLCFVLK